MDKRILSELRDVSSIDDFINIIRPYYPGFKVEGDLNIEKIEKELYHTFIKLIGKIIIYSPEHMRTFLKDYLLQFEIMNIKTLILGSIVGLSTKEKSKNVNLLVEEYLENVDFIKGLIEISNLEEIILYMKDSKYYEIVREGIRYYTSNNESFVLDAFLDQFYYLNLTRKNRNLKRHEKRMINIYIDSVTEIYNINIIYRGIRTNVDKKLLSQFLVDNYLFFNESIINGLLNLTTLEEFFRYLNKTFDENEKIKKIYRKIGINEDHMVWSLDAIYLNYIITEFETKIEDIEHTTIFNIINLLINKEKEIIFDILPNIIKLLHEKFERLKDYNEPTK